MQNIDECEWKKLEKVTQSVLLTLKLKWLIIQYLLSLITALGDGKCFYSKSISGLALFLLILGNSSTLLDTYLLLLSP